MTEAEYIRASNKQTLMILLKIQGHLLGDDTGHENSGVSAEDCKELCRVLDGMWDKCTESIEINQEEAAR